MHRILSLTVVLGLACAGPAGLPALSPDPAPAGVATTTEVPAWTQLAVYLPAPDPGAAQRWRDAVHAAWPEVTIREGQPTDLALGVWITSPPVADYSPPPPDLAAEFGVGLDDGEAARVAAAQAVVVGDWFSAGADALRAARLADETACALAAAGGGWIWDEQARLLYDAESFAAARLADHGWAGEVPIVGAHVATHVYDAGGYQRVVTVGLQKLGLPDLVVNGALDRHRPLVGHVPEMVAQALAQGVPVGADGAIVVDLGRLADPQHAELGASARERGGSGVLELSLRVAELQDGDAVNRLWEIDFGESAPDERYAAAEAALVRAFGAMATEEPMAFAPEDDAELAEVAVQARETLARLRREGQLLAPGTSLLVKAPFPTAAGSIEWMWVEVRAWDETTLRGALVNEPDDVPSLRVGSVVDVAQDEVADYFFTRSDGTREGGRSDEILTRRSAR